RSDVTLEPSRGNSTSLRAQLDRLGNTPFEISEFDQEGNAFVPASMANQLRRQAVEALENLLIQRPPRRGSTPAIPPPPKPEPPSTPALHLLVRNADQLEAALEVRPSSITLDYLDLYGLKPSLDRVKASGIEARVAGPRVLKPGEQRIADFLVSCGCPIL